MSPGAATSQQEPLVVALAPSAASISQARRHAGAVADGLLVPEQGVKLELLISEVVSNAIKHGRPREDVRLAMTPKDGYLCVQVTDAGPGLVPRPGAIGADDESAGWVCSSWSR
ncbi:MAG: ATP-binding protein [Actinomycetota bacterium]|nr:ATP-binding protein [Actinomycetota bacterium]